MRYLVLLLLMLFFAIGCECEASYTKDEECYPLAKVMNDPSMEGAKTCKFMENFCTFTSKRKSSSGEVSFSYTQQIPCYQFETYRAVYECKLENKDVVLDSERYKITQECIISKTSLIKK